jgi:hypothetical protein
MEEYMALVVVCFMFVCQQERILQMFLIATHTNVFGQCKAI